MRKLLLMTLIAGALAPQSARADELVTAQAPPLIASAAKLGLANVTPFITGLKEPQGLAIDPVGGFNSGILVADYGAGEVLRFNGTHKKEIVASGLKGPSQLAIIEGRVIVSERDANRIVRLSDGNALPVGGEIAEPMGLIQSGPIILVSGVLPKEPGSLRLSEHDWASVYVVSHATSRIYRLDKIEWKLVYQAPRSEGRFGLLCLAGDGNTLFLSDENNGEVLMMSSGGRVAKFATGIEKPAGLVVRGDWVYVCDDSKSGQLWKLDKNGVKTLAARNLGRPNNVLFLDDVTALVSDRNGRVLKLSWDN